jgi:exosortase
VQMKGFASLVPEPVAQSPDFPIGRARESAQLMWWCFVALVVVSVFAYWNVVTTTVKLLLASDDNAHGFFAPIVAAYIFWSERNRTFHAEPTGRVTPLVLLVVIAGVALFASAGGSTTLARFCFLLTIADLVFLVGGGNALRCSLFPICLLIFTFPTPIVLYGDLTQPLQLVASAIAEFTLELFGHSVFREGNILRLSTMRLSVAEACSGLRSLLTLCFLALSYGYLLDDRIWVRAMLVVAVIPFAILINGLRIAAVGILGPHDPTWVAGTGHDTLGWIALAFGFLWLILVHRLIEWRLRGRIDAKR